VSSRCGVILREYNVGRRFVGLGKAIEDYEKEAEEEEMAAIAKVDKKRSAAEQARHWNENFGQ